MEFIIKVSRLGSKAVVDGMALGADKRTSFDLPVVDYISASALPTTPLPSDGTLESAQQKLQEVFISPARLADLGVLLKLHIIQKLAPGISKEGYEEERETRPQRAPSPRPGRAFEPPGRLEPDPARANPYLTNDPLAGQPRRPHPDLEPPGFDDEYDILRAPGRPGVPPGPRAPLGIGHDDLYPPGLGPHDPLRPSFGPGGIGGLGGGTGGGMHPTFDDPMFGGRGDPRGGGTGDPQVPGGARYDPVGPGDPRAGMRFPGAGHRGPGGGLPNPFGEFGSGDFI
jgi:PI31 proteasome regulator N-terminal/PI31 proteasome regulator